MSDPQKCLLTSWWFHWAQEEVYRPRQTGLACYLWREDGKEIRWRPALVICCILSFLRLIQTNREGPWKEENECLPRACSISCPEGGALCIWAYFIPRGQYAYCISEMIYLKLRRPFQENCNQDCPWVWPKMVCSAGRDRKQRQVKWKRKEDAILNLSGILFTET